MKAEPRFVYRAGSSIIALVKEWQAELDRYVDAANAWNERHKDRWQVHCMRRHGGDFYIGSIMDLHPEYRAVGEKRQDLKAEMAPLRAGLTKAGTPFKDKRGDIWRDELAGLPPYARYEARFRDVGMGSGFWPDDDEDQRYYGSPGYEIIDGEAWVLSMFKIDERYHSDALLTPATLYEFYAAKYPSAER